MSKVLMEVKDVSLSYTQRNSIFSTERYHALKKVTFDLYSGETLGLIGRNGCGKSTLLKVLAGIYKQDSGSVVKEVSKVSLLTLGLGFDPELSGRDNALISAMLQGHSKKQAYALIDDIIDFAEIGEFAFKPIKTYSSGMRARLAFSVAVKSEADILLIDEVLAVGDSAFRKKAEDLMLSRINSDLTIVIVSHNTPQIKKLCDRVVWLEDGEIKMSGNSSEIMEHYEKHILNGGNSISE